MIGETLGHYRIDACLGAGGMGTVYRARDERLHRTVAIKVVGASGAGGSTPEDRSRLLDEARAASHLNHPHICTVYEVGDADGRAFIAMEYVAGRPLSESLPADGLPAETVVRFGVQIADALAHAHERGVVHRDLKTANVVVAEEQGVKVLDFGLARRIDTPAQEDLTRSIEESTERGTLIGTVAYIAPELLLGHPADARSDIWALGVVLYEMATGEHPFRGRNKFELTAAILRSPAHPFPPPVPPMLRAIISRCLTKEPAQRYQRAGEVRAALEAVQTDVLSTPIPTTDASNRTWLRWLAAGATGVALFVLAAWLFAHRPRGPWERGNAGGRLTRIVSSEDQTFDPSLSSDGRMLCYASRNADGRVDLFTVRVAGGGRVQLTNDDAREETPRFSPDGERIAFTRRDPVASTPEIRVVPSLGGEVLARIANAASPAWSPDGKRLVYVRGSGSDGATEVVTSTPDGSDARVIMRADSVYPFLRNPAWSPDGNQIAIVRGTGGVAGEIWLMPASGGSPRRAIEEGGAVFSDAPVYTPDGRGIVHTSNRGGATNLWFLPLSGDSPIRLTTGSGPDASPSISASGAVSFVNSRWRNTLDLYDLTSGTSRVLVTHTPFLWGPAVSPDGQEVAFSRSEEDGSWHIWTIDLSGGAPRRLTAGEAGEVYPRYSPDGTSVWFYTWIAPRRIGHVPSRGGPLEMFPLAGDQGYGDLSPDGKTLAFTRADADSERVYLASPNGEGMRALTRSSGAVPRWSPDGSLIAYAADRGFAGGIFLIKPNGTSGRRLTREGGWPVWWPGGREVGYLAVGADGNQEIRVASLDGSTRTLTNIKLNGTNHPFAIFPDGRRLVGSSAVHVSDEIWLLEPGR